MYRLGDAVIGTQKIHRQKNRN